MSRPIRLGGYIASAVLVVLGVAMIAIGLIGRADVQDRLAQENIVGSPDMTPEETEPAVEEAGLTDVIEIPDCSVAEEEVDSGSEAKCFASYMRVHALEATGGKTYAEMPRAVFKDTGKPVPEDEVEQALGSGEAEDNPERTIWINATALSTALNTSFFAESVAMFTIVVGIALILIGIGLLVLTRGAAREAELPSRPAA
jgi:hypothetical protein